MIKDKRGLATWVVILMVTGIILVVGVPLVYFGYLATVPAPPVPVDYEGEFDDAYLATKGNFYSEFTEGTDCNITSDVLGGASYTSCIYDTAEDIAGQKNSTNYQLDLVIDIDGDVENLEIEGNLQNTGTGQAKDDIIIEEVQWWTYEDSDETTMLFGSDDFNIDNEDGEFALETGVLEGDEYVLHILLKTKLVQPTFADGDDILKVEMDLTTDGDTDAARILLEE